MPHQAQQDSAAARGPLAQQIGRFLVVGAAATAAHYLAALLAVQYTNVYAANLLGYLTAVAISYFGHQRFSFQLHPDVISHNRQFPRFVAGSLGGLALSYLVLAVSKNLLHTPDWLSLAIAVTLVPTFTFIINKLWVFNT